MEGFNKLNNKLSIITIGSTRDEGIFLTIESVLKNAEKIYKWIFVVFNKKEKEVLINYFKKKNFKINYLILFNSEGITPSLNLAINQIIFDETYIWILHAGDISLENISNHIDYDLNYDIHFFAVNIKSKKFSESKIAHTHHRSERKIKHSPCVLHQGVIAKSNLFKKYGLFNERYSSIMDYEWFYRLSNLPRNKLKTVFHKVPISEFILGGKSANVCISFKEHFNLYCEYEKNIYKSFFKAGFLFLKKLIYVVVKLYYPLVSRFLRKKI